MAIVPPLPLCPATLPPRAARYWNAFWCAGAPRASHAPGWDLPVLLAAICETETLCGADPGLDRPGPMGRGDGGHGHGLFQIDDRTHAPWLAMQNDSGIFLWTIPEENARYAMNSVLVPAMARFPFEEELAIASFNAGAGHVHKTVAALTEKKVRVAAANAVTEHGTYVTRVLQSYRTFGGKQPSATS